MTLSVRLHVCLVEPMMGAAPITERQQQWLAHFRATAPFSADLFIFCNRARSLVKMVACEGNGFASG